MAVLLVEDDVMISSGIQYALEAEGHEVVSCADAQQAYTALRTHDFSLGILDITLPDGTGFDVFEAIQKQGEFPVIFVTAMDDETNVIKGLEMGAEDYIAKPFRIRELLARVKTVLRRGVAESKTVNMSQNRLHLQDVTIHTDTAKVYKQQNELELTALEYRLLLTFARHKGQTLTRNQILEILWDDAGNYVNDNTLTVYIKRLREKLEDIPQAPKIIVTVRGIGYRSEG